MTERDRTADHGGRIDRRTMLRLSSAAVASGTAFSGMASASGGGRQNGTRGRNDTDSSNGGDGTDELVVFCGCSQVCACNCPVEVYIAGAEDQEILGGSGCYESDEGQIVAIRYRTDEDERGEYSGELICNPNTNCADFSTYDGDLDRDDCDAQGTRPRDGARCGDAFLKNECSVE